MLAALISVLAGLGVGLVVLTSAFAIAGRSDLRTLEFNRAPEAQGNAEDACGEKNLQPELNLSSEDLAQPEPIHAA